MIRFLNVYYPTRTVVLFLCEALLVGSCFLLATVLVLGQEAYLAFAYEYALLKVLGITALTVVLSYYFDLYEPQIVSLPLEIYFRILLVLGFDCFILSAVLYFYPEADIAHFVYAVGFALLTPVLIAWRRAYGRVVSHKLFRERVYVLGAGEQARSIVHTIRSRPDIGMEVIGWKELELDKPERKQVWIQDLAKLGPAKDGEGVHRIIVAMEDSREELPVQELLGLRFQGVIVEKVGDLAERLTGKIQLEGLHPSNFLYVEGFRMRASQQLTRQIVSTAAAAVGLLLFLPFFPFVVLAVRMSSKGPIFFRQTRIGAGGRQFQVVKFRTMFTDAEAAGAKWATKNDPRVTKVGMFMRKTRIDEIPQLWNVLRGDMGFVGPRPERPEFVPWLAEQLPFYYLRNLIRPGLTGWAQVRYGYGATLAETKEKLEYDLYYVKHMSLGLDLLIMFETIKTIVRRRGSAVRGLFWLSLLVILYTYAGYPLAIALLAKVAPRGWRRAAWPTGPPPISVVMAVHNGATLLAGQIDHLLGLDAELVKEIVIVSDGSTDTTATILSAANASRLEVIILPEQVGKAAALNHGIAAATGEVLLFVDIRPRIEIGALAALLANFADPTVGCVAGELLLRTEGHDATMAAVSGLYWKYEQWIRNCEAAWDSPVGVYGGFYAIRRSLATPTPAGTILDDMFQPLSVIRQGYRSVLDRTALVVDIWPAKASGEFSRKVRTLAGNFQLVALAPWVLTPTNRVFFQLVSHKLLRLVVPYFFVLLLASSAALGYFVFAAVQAAFWLLALVSIRFQVPVLHRLGTPAGALLVLNAAAVVALWRFLFTKAPLWKMWKPTPVAER